MSAISSVFRIRVEALASGTIVVKISRFYGNDKQRTRYYHNVTPPSLRRILSKIPEFASQ